MHINQEGARGTSSNDQLMQRNLGVNIHTRPMGSHSLRDGAHTTFDNQIIKEEGWDLIKAVEKPQIIASIPWTTTFPNGSHLAGYDLPTDIFTSSPFMSFAFRSFQYWRGDLEVHLQVNGTPFHQGTVVLVYVPLMSKTNLRTSQALINPATITSLQHVFLHANSSTSACMTIPFINNRLYISPNATGTSANEYNTTTGSLHLLVFNGLQVASGSSDTIDVSIIAQFKNSQFKVPALQTLTSFRGEGMLQMMSEKMFGASFGHVIQRMIPKNIVADSIDAITGFFGLDKPTSIERMAPMKMLGTQYMNSSVEIDYLDKLTLYPSKMQEVDPLTFSVGIDEMNFDVLKKKYSYMGSFIQKTTDLPGSVLAVYPISPCPVPILTSYGSPSVPNLNNVPLLQYITLPFQYWKGGLNYKIQVVASSFQVTKIFVGIQYGNYAVPPPAVNINNLSSLYGYIFEVNQGATEFQFTAPYISAHHQLNVTNSNDINEDTTCGMIYIAVLNKMAITNNVVDLITYNVFVAGADDYTVSTISSAGNSLYPVVWPPPAFSGESVLSTPFTDTEHAHDENVIGLSGLGPRMDVCEQSIGSISEVLKKYSHIGTGVALVNPTNGVSTVGKTIPIELRKIFFNYIDTGSTTFQFKAYNNMSYFSAMYGGIKGPLRLKIALRSAPINTSFRVQYYPPTGRINRTLADSYITDCIDEFDSFLPGIYSAAVRPKQQLSFVNSVQKSAEFELPFNSQFLFTRLITVPGNQVTSDTDLGFITITVTAPTSTTTDTPENGTYVEFDIFCSFGDETRYGVFMGVPALSAVYTLEGSAGGIDPTPQSSGDDYNNLNGAYYGLVPAF